jgi:Fe-S-cluster containining protein
VPPLPIVDTPSVQELPTVRALEALWQEVRRKPLWAPPNLGRYLRLRWTTRLTLIDPAQVRVAAPRGKVNDCTACTDICCVGERSTVLLHLRDIAALVDIGRTDLIAREKPRFSDEEQAARPALARTLRSRTWRIFPRLAQNSMNACKALTTEGKCSLYPHWPLSCARFPYSLHLDDREVFYSSRCDAFYLIPDGRAEARISAMKAAAVESYNARIKDLVLLAYAPHALEHLGLLRFLDRAS